MILMPLTHLVIVIIILLHVKETNMDYGGILQSYYVLAKLDPMHESGQIGVDLYTEALELIVPELMRYKTLYSNMLGSEKPVKMIYQRMLLVIK